MVTLTVVVPATNDPPTLEACLEAIAAAEFIEPILKTDST